ncbi:unnamed protein product [Closterium sp. NIES-53]
MGEQESAMDYCNRAQRILVEMRMAGAEYSMASYITHIVKGLPRGYNLMKRMMMVPGTGESLNEDSITSYILQDEVMQEAEQPTEPFRQASYAAPTKQNRHQEQRGKPGGGGSGGGQLTKDIDEKRLTRDKGQGAVQANLMEVLLDSGCSHHLMGTKAVFVDMAPSDGVKHVPGFNGALQPVGGRGTVVLQGEARKWVLIPDVLYVPGVHAKVLSAIQLKESGVQLKGDGDVMLLVSTKVVALRTIVSATKSTPDWLHARLAHIGVDRIKSSAKHEVANGLDITPSTGVDTPCVSCVRGKLVRHTFPDKGSDAEKALAVVHIDLCGPFWVAAKDGSLYFLLLKDRHTRFVWVMPVAKKSNVLREFKKWLREMHTAVESVRRMLLHMGVQHHWWHLALRHAVGVGNCLERSTTPPGTTPYQLLTGKKPDLTMAHVWGCMVEFMVPEQQRGGKVAPKTRWGLHVGVLPETKGWEVLNLTDNKVVTSVEVIFYETLSQELWKAKFRPASGRTQAHLSTDTSMAMVPLLAEVDEPADDDVVEVLPVRM